MINLFDYHSNPQQLNWYNIRTKLIPELAYDEAINNSPNRSPDLEPAIIHTPIFAYLYAKHIINDRWKEAEPTIKQHPTFWTLYTHHFNIED